MAIAALAATFYQSYLTRQHNRMTLRPILSLYFGAAGMSPHAVFMETAGIGPAIVGEIKAEMRSRPLDIKLTYHDYAAMKNWENPDEYPKSPLLFTTGTMNRPQKLDPSTRLVLGGLRVEGFKKLTRKGKENVLCSLSQDFIVTAKYCSLSKTF